MTDEKGHIPHRFGADGNLRLYSYDRLFYSLYGYDGGTTRTYKYSMDLSPNWVNGRLEAVNFNSNGYYTKHYYNGMERIASRLGDKKTIVEHLKTREKTKVFCLFSVFRCLKSINYNLRF